MKKKKMSIKFRITFWYMVIFSLLLTFVLANVYVLSEKYSIHDLDMELQDETADMVEELRDHRDSIRFLKDSDWTSFYDDNVMISIYQEDGRFVNGVLPDHFPEDISFSENETRKIESDSEIWLLYDYYYEEEGGMTLWIRSIASYSYWARILQEMLLSFTILFPIVVILSGVVGYVILKRALFPIYTISDAAKEIAGSVDLSKRIEISEIQDEFSYLTEAFNTMIAELEDSFEKEKQFTSDAAHELRTPIAVIQGHCEYCLEDLNLSDEVKEEIQIIYRKTMQISQLVSQLLAIARAERRGFTPEDEEVDLICLVESVMEELEEKAEKKHISMKLENTLAEKDTMIHGDMMLLMRMMYNLIENAISYGKETGSVIIALSKTENHTLIRVCDDGIGIAPEEQEKIWNRFYRVDKSRSGQEGFGLGLAMVRYIVEMHGGKIWLESEPGKGSTFTVALCEKRKERK